MLAEPSRPVLVTGGAQGLGRAFCLDLAERGYRVVVADVESSKASTVGAEIGSAGGDALLLELDVSDERSCERAARALAQEPGSLCGLVNNAAIFSALDMKPFWELSLAEWNQVLAVNVTRVWLGTRALLSLLRHSENASIVNISAAAVWSGRAGYARYAASKAGVVGLSRAMARELDSVGIRVNTVTPGSVETGIPRATVSAEQRRAIVGAQCLNRVITPEDITGAVAFLLDRSSLGVIGQVINVDGGMVKR